MKKGMLLVGVVCVLAAAPVLAAPTVTTVNGYGIWQSGQGGEFTLVPTGFNPLPLYAASAKDQGWTGSFQTFCLERNEYIYPNTAFDVVFNDGAVLGGVGGKDPISLGTAYLYHEFQNGTLAGYDYGNTGVGRLTSAADLQDAIWYLEGEGGSVNAAYTTMLTTEFGSVANATLDNNGRFGVAVLNLYALGHAGDMNYLRQDMLVCVPAPGAILLGGIGISLVGWLKRRRSL